MEGSFHEKFEKLNASAPKKVLPKTEEPENNKVSIRKTGIFDKIKNVFKKSKADTNANTIAVTRAESTIIRVDNNLAVSSNGPKKSSPEHLGKNYIHVDESSRVEQDNHVLTHISLNPDSINDKDKYLYYYEVGTDRDPIITSKYLESSGKSKDYNGQDVELPVWMKKGIYLQGEEVINKTTGERNIVISNIDYDHKTGEANYCNILVKDMNGQIKSVPRSSIKLNSPDRSIHSIVNTDAGNKYLHDLKEGDLINHEGNKHYVMYSDPTIGIATVNQKSGQMHFTSVIDFHKPYLSEVKPEAK